jgi:hypothetical protein
MIDDEYGAVGGVRIDKGNASFFLSSYVSFAPYLFTSLILIPFQTA